MLKELVKKFKSVVDDTEEINEKYFAEVMKEIKDGYKEEGLEGKSIAMSSGDEKKANSIYIQLRAEYLQNKAIQEHRGALLKEERQRKQAEREKEEKSFNFPQALQELKNKGTLLKLYTKDINDLGYQRNLFGGLYALVKDGDGYDWIVDMEEKKLLIYKSGHYKNPETTFNLEDKAEEIIALAKKSR